MGGLAVGWCIATRNGQKLRLLRAGGSGFRVWGLGFVIFCDFLRRVVLGCSLQDTEKSEHQICLLLTLDHACFNLFPCGIFRYMHSLLHSYERPSKLALISLGDGHQFVVWWLFDLQNIMGHAENDNPNMMLNIYDVWT